MEISLGEREAIERLSIANKDTKPGEEVTVSSDDLDICLGVPNEALSLLGVNWKW